GTSRYRDHLFFFSSRRRHTRSKRDWSSDVCSSDLTRVHRGWTVDRAVIDTAFAHVGNNGGNGGLGDFFTEFIGQDGTWICDTCCGLGTPGFFALHVVNFWTVAVVGQGEVRFGNGGDQATG